MDSKGEFEDPSSALAALEDDDIERNLHDDFYKINPKNEQFKLGFCGHSDTV